MKQCAYCGTVLEKKNNSKEHIIPNGLIGLFPEQNITFTSKKAYKHKFGQSIKDVCRICNNGYLSELDTYGINLIKLNFMKKFRPDDKLNISFDFNKMCRWLLKIAFNHERVEKNDCAWFRENIDYINGTSDISGRCSVFAGLHVDMNPLGEENDEYLPLSIGRDLKFYNTGLKNTTIEGTTATPLNFEDIYMSYSFRFASARLILILWENSSIVKEIESTERLIQSLFPYKNINEPKITLERANEYFSGRNINLIIGKVGMLIMDETMKSVIPKLDATQKTSREFNNSEDKTFDTIFKNWL